VIAAAGRIQSYAVVRKTKFTLALEERHNIRRGHAVGGTIEKPGVLSEMMGYFIY
jgi:hypothetical protein